MRHRMNTFALLLAAVLVLAACGTDAEQIPDPTPQDGASGNGDEPLTLDGDWVLTSATIDGAPLTLLPDWRVTMTVDGNQITGRAACNSYFGEVDLSDGGFAVGGVGQTEMACEPQVMEVEAAFTGALTRVATATRSGATLTLAGDDVTLEFAQVEPVAAAELLGTTWMLDTIIQGDAASSTFADAEEATLHLTADGTFTGSTGCRTVAGEYVITGDTVQFTSFGADGDCPQALSQQDSQVITVLEGPFTVSIDGNRLTIMAPGGEGLGYLAQP